MSSLCRSFGRARLAFSTPSSRVQRYGSLPMTSDSLGSIGAGKSTPFFKTDVSSPYSLVSKRLAHSSAPEDESGGSNARAMDFVRGILEEDGKGFTGGLPYSRYNVGHDVDIVHFKLMQNNTFVTVTDSKGNKKFGASAGCLPEMRGGPKMSKYAAEATAEHVGRMSRSLGLKSVVMRVNGFTHFKKKRQAIMSWREGFTNSRGDQNPIVYIEDTTRRPHNGCRLPKKRRV